MLSDSDILNILADQRNDVQFNIVTTFTDSRSEDTLNRRVFSSSLLPVPPPLCFFETWADSDLYGMSSFFDLPDPKYTIVPFGSKKANVDRVDYGMSYNVFEGSVPTQCFTIALDGTNVPERSKQQSHFFQETFAKQKLWDAGHLIAHRYSPASSSPGLCSTRQFGFNFIPEPAYWNRYQRNPLEDRCRGGYYGVYPVYHLRYVHGRTVKPYASGDLKLPYRPIPDGELFYGIKEDASQTILYMPFVAPDDKIYDSRVTEDVKRKIDATIPKHKVNRHALPVHIKIDFTRGVKRVASELNSQVAEDEKLSNGEDKLLLATNTNPQHHAAIIQTERAATKEVTSPANKMRNAIIFSDLMNRPRTQVYVKAVCAHSKLLLDKCEAEDPPKALFPHRLLKDFNSTFPDEEQSNDQLKRLEPTYKLK